MEEENKKYLTFEKQLERLEEIASILEKGEVSFSDGAKLFEEGTKLAKECLSKINNEKKIVETIKVN